MTKTTTPRAFLMAGALLTTALASLLVPAAAAHYCIAENPAEDCGPCTRGDHTHVYPGGRTYCYSEDPLCPPLCSEVQDPRQVIENLLS